MQTFFFPGNRLTCGLAQCAAVLPHLPTKYFMYGILAVELTVERRQRLDVVHDIINHHHGLDDFAELAPLYIRARAGIMPSTLRGICWDCGSFLYLWVLDRPR